MAETDRLYSEYVFESGHKIELYGEEGGYVFDKGDLVTVDGRSQYVFVSGTGLGDIQE